ncbi:MAG: tetratricopeptide repeat protein, partial [Rubripirellula sp.]
LELGGQLRFDFDSFSEANAIWDDGDFENSPIDHSEDESPSVLSFRDAQQLVSKEPADRTDDHDPDELLQAVYEAEDADDLATAIDLCHAILARDGARAEVSFQLAELLYRSGHLVAARERYYAAIELDPEFVEARASLANVLAETGQTDLAVAAFRGAISLHPGYVEAHFGLANLLEQMGDHHQAAEHWRMVIQFAPQSPWAQQARSRLQSPDCPH